MPWKQSEAIVLRSYPLREADLLVTLFTRAEGKLKGVARAAKKSKRRFGGALEPLTLVRLYYDDREGRELARLDACDILESPLSAALDYPHVVALEHVAETLDELLPDREANDAIFRLAVAVLHQLRSGPIWMPLIYFQLWLVRLVGFLPKLDECVACGATLNGSPAYYHALADGMMCAQHKRLASSQLSPESRALAAAMFRAPVESFAESSAFGDEGSPVDTSRGGNAGAAQYGDLRRFLVQIIERHLEKELVTASILARL
ncbi:MAG TPA: DNA repair protein RecO [Terriglobales bacterium]|nr:DNA repair protein RecO [Terriglobales bacterium]